MGLEIFHVFDPFEDQLGIHAFDIVCEMTDICRRKCGEVPPCFQLFCQVVQAKG